MATALFISTDTADQGRRTRELISSMKNVEIADCFSPADVREALMRKTFVTILDGHGSTSAPWRFRCGPGRAPWWTPSELLDGSELGAARLLVIACDGSWDPKSRVAPGNAIEGWVAVPRTRSEVIVTQGKISYKATRRLYRQLVTEDPVCDFNRAVQRAAENAGYSLRPEEGSIKFCPIPEDPDRSQDAVTEID